MTNNTSKFIGFKFSELNIRTRLLLGFSVICMVLIVTVGLTIMRLGHINDDISHIDKLRVPTATASSALVKDIHASLASLRGYMLTGKNTFKAERGVVWKDIYHLVQEIDNLSKNWENSNNIEQWAVFKVTLNEFRQAQEKVEKTVNSADQYPANEILTNEALPRATVMFSTITQLIDMEAKLPATRDRKKLLGIMADVRGTLGLGLANIRAFLLTGESQYQDKFLKLWEKNEKRFRDLQGMKGFLKGKQKTDFEVFSKERTEFNPLPLKMFSVRNSDKWNMANYLLMTEAAPRANKLFTILNGENGKGGIVASQRILLSDDVADALAQSHSVMVASWVLLTLGVIVSGVVGILSARSITLPISRITAVMTKLAAGDVSVKIIGLNRKDEIRTMAVAVEEFKQNALSRIRLEQENRDAELAQQERVQERKEAEDARKKIEDDREKQIMDEQKKRTDYINGLIKGFENKVTDVLGRMGSSSIEMSATAKKMVDTSSDTKDRSSIVASASEEAANNIGMVAAAAEELSSSVSEISRQISQANEISLEAVKEAGESENAIEALAESANKINNVIAIISDIAEQTNLLALNATIESARAGEAGKGFAVVANEVKALAGQTSSATDEISKQISEMQALTAVAVNSIKTIVEVNNKSNETTANIQIAIEQQSLATVEISQNIQQVVTGTTEVSNNIIQVAKGADETGLAGEQVFTVAEELGKVAKTLKADIEGFLTDVRTA